MRPLIVAMALAAAVGVAACGSGAGAGNPDSKLTEKQATEPIPGAPPQLAAIRAQGNQILDGGTDAFNARLAELKGTPVVVNKWASWCGPCRAEFSYFGDQAGKRKDVVFIGVDSNDNDGNARDFLADHPVPYKHFKDPKLEIAAAFNGVQAFPTTAFYDKQGKLVFTHPGGYQSEDQLAEDIDRYAR
jgi:cytochrome c biogenesis protein CcmG, thiol:disulfide interchange protein DsbE